MRPDQVLKASPLFFPSGNLNNLELTARFGIPVEICVHVLVSEPFVKFHENRCDLAAAAKNGRYEAGKRNENFRRLMEKNK